VTLTDAEYDLIEYLRSLRHARIEIVVVPGPDGAGQPSFAERTTHRERFFGRRKGNGGEAGNGVVR